MHTLWQVLKGRENAFPGGWNGGMVVVPFTVTLDHQVETMCWEKLVSASVSDDLMKPLYQLQTASSRFKVKRNKLLLFKPPLPFFINARMDCKTAFFCTSLRKKKHCQINGYPIQVYDTFQIQSSNVTKVWVLLHEMQYFGLLLQPCLNPNWFKKHNGTRWQVLSKEHNNHVEGRTSFYMKEELQNSSDTWLNSGKFLLYFPIWLVLTGGLWTAIWIWTSRDRRL